eukprot:GDKH01004914.1.p1 GENE.GDKH01004914.1~~GDKH01004914.1.p1  ORF type:complete len:224 (+),score=22.88 GDKH01004914.1:142-813(+)
MHVWSRSLVFVRGVYHQRTLALKPISAYHRYHHFGLGSTFKMAEGAKSVVEMERELNQINESLAKVSESDESEKARLRARASTLTADIRLAKAASQPTATPDSKEHKPSLAQYAEVDIDVGTFKYALIRASDPKTGEFRMLVRGYLRAAYHYMCAEGTIGMLETEGLEGQVQGGGRIHHSPEQKTIEIYGYSCQYGRANHAVTADLCRKQFPGYEVSWNNDGY